MVPRKSMQPRMRGVFCTALACAAVAIWPDVSWAANQEPAGINLGSTSFFDGFGRNEEGFTYLNYLQYGKALPFFNDPKIDAFVFVNQLAYVLPEKLFDDSAHLGINFILPIVAFNTSFAPAPPAPGYQLKD